MTYSGRRPKLTVFKQREGNRGKRPLNDREPIPMPGAPDCPDWLDPYAKALWEWVVPQLEQMQIVGRCDTVGLVALCQSFSHWRKADEEIARDGITYRPFVVLDNDGNVVEPDDPRATKAVQTIRENPACRVSDRERRACLDAASHLGLTPSMRSKIMTYQPPTSTSSLPSLLSRPEVLRGEPQDGGA